MVNEEILGGLKSALERGQPLQKAMMTLYNSGYKKEEIEEAARNLMEQQSQLQPAVKAVPKTAEIRRAPQVLTTPKVKSFPEFQAPLRMPQSVQPLQKQAQQLAPITQPAKQVFMEPIKYTPQQLIQPTPMQKVSNYGLPASKEKIKEKRVPKEKVVIFTLIFLLIFLIGLLGVIFIFKQELIDFFSTLFV
jgi:hypothetical protein